MSVSLGWRPLRHRPCRQRMARTPANSPKAETAPTVMPAIAPGDKTADVLLDSADVDEASGS